MHNSDPSCVCFRGATNSGSGHMTVPQKVAQVFPGAPFRGGEEDPVVWPFGPGTLVPVLKRLQKWGLHFESIGGRALADRAQSGDCSEEENDEDVDDGEESDEDEEDEEEHEEEDDDDDDDDDDRASAGKRKPRRGSAIAQKRKRRGKPPPVYVPQSRRACMRVCGSENACMRAFVPRM